ncbi:hypothetical protein [Marinobacter sp. X15-166B]|uniref:hypothetical protein n=1 Tax=Marinobacter sp. X15-166B TaxID=1897620 RepID=UPI00085BCF48|nr:hypothetical protein [Marinobacter sp. X15-166B]OEY67434.1 hypothetical protein BG841_14005 [Marinobacter sp. X15-166B]
MDNKRIVECLIVGLENLKLNATDNYSRGYIRAMLQDANRLLRAEKDAGIPETRLKCAGMIDLFDEDEPGNKEVVKYGLLLEFPNREAMAEAFEKGVCRYSFGFENPEPGPTFSCPECCADMAVSDQGDPECDTWSCPECDFNEPDNKGALDGGS